MLSRGSMRHSASSIRHPARPTKRATQPTGNIETRARSLKLAQPSGNRMLNAECPIERRGVRFRCAASVDEGDFVDIREGGGASEDFFERVLS